MAHNKDILLPNLLSDTAVIAKSQLREIDQRASESINGDEGGLWEPENPISVGGDGVEFDNAGFIRGGVTSKGQGLNPAISFKAGHWPSHNPVKPRRVVFPMRARLWNNYEDIGGNENWRAQDGILRFTKYDSVMTMIVPLDIHKFPFSGKISSFTLNFKVGINATPLDTIYFALIAKSNVRNEAFPSTRISPWQPSHLYPLNSIVISSTFSPDNYSTPYAYQSSSSSKFSGTVEPAGFAAGIPSVSEPSPSGGSITWVRKSIKDTANIINLFRNKYTLPATQDLYYNGGNPKSVTVSNLNVFPSVSNYDYMLYIRDATQTRNSFMSLVVDFTDISQMRNVL